MFGGTRRHPEAMTGSTSHDRYDTSTDPSRGLFRRRVVSTLGLLVVLFNLVAGTLLASTSTSGAAPFLEETFGDRIVVCTGAGMIVLDADGNPLPQDGTAPMCVFCLPLVHGGADAPVMVALLDTPLAVEPVNRGDERHLAPTVAPTVASASPRGPPLA